MVLSELIEDCGQVGTGAAHVREDGCDAGRVGQVALGEEKGCAGLMDGAFEGPEALESDVELGVVGETIG